MSPTANLKSDDDGDDVCGDSLNVTGLICEFSSMLYKSNN